MPSKDKRKKDRGKDKTYRLFYLLVGVACLVLILVRVIFNPITVIGSSMSPTYHDGEVVALAGFDHSQPHAEIGDIIVFTDGRERLVKRIVGLPGDLIQIRDGILYRNGESVEETYEPMEDAGLAAEEYTVPEGCVFVLGDNRNHSRDSREFGAVSYDDIIGVVTRTLIRRSAS